MHYTQQIRELAKREQQRFVDMAILLRRATTKETLLCAGGVWDQLDQEYRINPKMGVRVEPDSARVFDLNEAQVPLARWYAGELAAFRQGFKRRERMGLAIGDRRSGKTVGTIALAVATNVDVPKIGWHGLITWIVGVARPEMQELDRYITWMLPAAWYRESIQEHAYNLNPHKLIACRPDPLFRLDTRASRKERLEEFDMAVNRLHLPISAQQVQDECGFDAVDMDNETVLKGTPS